MASIAAASGHSHIHSHSHSHAQGHGATWSMDEDKHENHWRRTFCQVPFPAIYAHAERGKRSLHRVVEFFRRRAEAERTAQEELRDVLHTPVEGASSAHLEDLEEAGTSIRRALAAVTNYGDALCHQQLLLAQVLQEQVAEPLVSLQHASEPYIRTLEDVIRDVNDEYTQALQAHATARSRLQRASEELGEAMHRQTVALHGIGVPAFELQRLATRVARSREERDRAELARAQAKTQLYKRIVARDEMAMAVSVAYQKAEEERLDQLNACLTRFVHIERERLKASEKLLATLESHTQGMSRAEDIQLLIHTHRNPDNLHFQGKALALLDWHWNKSHGKGGPLAQEEEEKQTEPRGKKPQQHVHFQRLGEEQEQEQEEGEEIPSYPVDGSTALPGAYMSPHGALAQTPMGRALHDLFAVESYPNTPIAGSPGPGWSSQEEGVPVTSDNDTILSVLKGEPVLMAKESSQKEGAEEEDKEGEEEEAGREEQEGEGMGSRVEVEVKTQTHALEDVVMASCSTHKGRALFVKCLNRQRSLETRVKDTASFNVLVSCFNRFLDCCMQDDDVKAAKTAMILAETFYAARVDDDEPGHAHTHEGGGNGEDSRGGEGGGNSTPTTAPSSPSIHETQLPIAAEDDQQRTSEHDDMGLEDCVLHASAHHGDHQHHHHPSHHHNLPPPPSPSHDYHHDDPDNHVHSPMERRNRGESWGSLPHAIGRGASRRYLQEDVKRHAIWKNPSFWEKALLLAIGEELQKTPQPCAWEDLPTRQAHSTGGSGHGTGGGGDSTTASSYEHMSHSNGSVSSGHSGSGRGGDRGLPTREEAVSRVHNIVFGQLGSFTLSMLEFDVPFLQIESFVETMCDAHELTEDQRFLLRKNLQEIFATLK